MIYVLMETVYDYCDSESNYTKPIAASLEESLIKEELSRLQQLEDEPSIDNPFYSCYKIVTVPELFY